jgi:hypothetical protein
MNIAEVSALQTDESTNVLNHYDILAFKIQRIQATVNKFCLNKSMVNNKLYVIISQIAGSLPAEAVGFFRRKNPQYAFLRKRSKAVCPMSQIFGMLKNPIIYRGSRKL